MNEYERIGFKCGLEIHNRLQTKYKLFCKCFPRFSNQKPIKTISRKLRPSAGETGQVDIAAIFEYLKDKTFNYDCYKDETCLVCTDSEPPHEINSEALEIVLQVCKLLNAEIADELQIMRKIVIDGSNTTGFQRTILVGTDGKLETSLGKIKIETICLEEESAGIVEQKENQTNFRLDRLGIPLIEIATAPEIKSPEHAKEVAQKIGMIIRSTGKSQRGLGVTRQDLNISLKGGARVEIKGVQELDLIPTIIQNEITRQISLRGNSIEETRIALPDGTTKFTRPLPGGERMYPETDIPTFQITKNILNSIKVPETLEEKLEKLKKDLPADLAEQLIKSEYLPLFYELSNYDKKLVASTLVSTLKELKRDGIATENLTEEKIKDCFLALEKQRISKEALSLVLEALAKEPQKSIGEAIADLGITAISESDLKNIIHQTFEKFPKLVEQKNFSGLMGEVMLKVRGKIDGKLVAKILKQELENY